MGVSSCQYQLGGSQEPTQVITAACLSHCSIAVKGLQEQLNLQKKAFDWEFQG